MSDTDPRIDVLSQANVEHVPGPADVTTVLVTLPPGSAGSPPHRHPGPVFGYLISGEMRFEVEGEPERIIRAGEAFWEPGGDLIHYQDANNLDETGDRLHRHGSAAAGRRPARSRQRRRTGRAGSPAGAALELSCGGSALACTIVRALTARVRTT